MTVKTISYNKAESFVNEIDTDKSNRTLTRLGQGKQPSGR